PWDAWPNRNELPMSTSHRQSRESGFAVPLAVAVMIFAGIIIVSVVATGTLTKERSQTTGQHSLAQGPADEGTATWVRGLNARVIGEHTDFLATQAVLTSLV